MRFDIVSPLIFLSGCKPLATMICIKYLAVCASTHKCERYKFLCCTQSPAHRTHCHLCRFQPPCIAHAQPCRCDENANCEREWEYVFSFISSKRMQNILPPDAVIPIAAYICCVGVVDGSTAAVIRQATLDFNVMHINIYSCMKLCRAGTTQTRCWYIKWTHTHTGWLAGWLVGLLKAYARVTGKSK